MSVPTVAKKSESKPPAKTKAKPKSIRGYKAVNKDLSSIHDKSFKYVVGKEAVVANPDPKGVCGKGIHFSRTMDFPLEYAGFDTDNAEDFSADFKMLELRVNPADILDESAEKARAKKVFVVGVVKKFDFPDYGPVEKRLTKLDGKLGRMGCQTPEKRLRDLFSNFTRRNNLKGYSLKLVTSPYEAAWLADELGSAFTPTTKGGNSSYAECSSSRIQDLISDVTGELCDVFYCNNGCDQIQESVSWIMHSLVCNVKPGAPELKVDALMEMLEAGALPLGYSTANKSKTVYWFVPSTTSTKWFPTV